MILAFSFSAVFVSSAGARLDEDAAPNTVLFHLPVDPLSRSTLVVVQQSSQVRAPKYGAGRIGRGRPRNQPIVESLVIPFEMIVLHKLRDRASEVPLPQRNHSTETFFLDRPNESLGVRLRGLG